ncbi:hypothetical protein CPB84DRAFT_1960759 [Gymnopilus junonius]|nr:hypothetical protein CPB84DRAFT_1960759 [Gymnopilus junonius]
MALWITVMMKSPWNADSTLSQFFESIPSSKGASRSITALLALVCLSVVSFVCLLASAFTPEFYKPNKAATNVTTVSEGVAAASIPKPAPSSHPTDLEKNSNNTSAVPVQPNPTSAENNDRPEMQDGAG